MGKRVYDKEKERERARRYYQEHRDEIKDKQRQASKERREAEGEGVLWTLVLDPDPSAAIHPGTILDPVEKSSGLVNGTFTPGTILAKGDRQYLVYGDVGTHQKLRLLC